MAFRTGYVALIGKPNVGKSTMLNYIVGQKVSIVSSKPQTTRRRVVGVAHGKDYQIVFIDTPGIHDPHTHLAKTMIDQAKSALADVEVVVYVANVSHAPDELDKQIAKQVLEAKVPVILALNKMDMLKAEFVAEYVEAYNALFKTEENMLTIATRGQNVDKLVELIVAKLPEGDPIFPEDEFTDQSSRYMASEIIREKILMETRQEIPHSVAVRVDEWDTTNPTKTHISAVILVEKTSQRGILIGKGGQFLKNIGTLARKEIEELIDHPIYLELHVKVELGWRMNPRIIHELEHDVQ